MKVLQVLCICALPTVAVAEDLEGIWFGGVGNGPQEWQNRRASVGIQPYVVDDLVQITLNFDGWKGIGMGQCVYYGRLDSDGAANLLLSEGKSSQAWQAARTREAKVQMQRLAPDRIEAVVEGITGLDPTPVPLSEALRPLAKSEWPVQPQGADILGISIGMTRTEAEAVLRGRGYDEVPRDVPGMRGADWAAAYATYAKPRAEGSEARDEVTLSYTTVATEDSDATPALVLSMMRSVVVDQAEPLQPEVIRKALNDKYGPMKEDNGTRYFDPAGAAASYETWCGTGTMQRFTRATATQSGGEYSPYCGTEVRSSFNIDSATGLVRNYFVEINSAGIAANDFWYRIRGGIARDIAQFLAANASEGAKPPDL